jgi:hypothetical protein
VRHVTRIRASLLSVVLSAALLASAIRVLPPAIVAADPAEAWPMFRFAPSRAGHVTASGPDVNYTLWTYMTGGAVSSSPAVVDG